MTARLRFAVVRGSGASHSAETRTSRRRSNWTAGTKTRSSSSSATTPNRIWSPWQNACRQMPTWPSWLWPGNCSPWDEAPADRYWWPETDISIARGLEGDTKYRTRGGKHLDYEGPIWRFVSENLLLHWRIRPSELDLCNSFHSGAFLLETVPCALNILMQHATDPEEGDHPRGQRHEGQRHHRRHRRGGRRCAARKEQTPQAVARQAVGADDRLR